MPNSLHEVTAATSTYERWVVVERIRMAIWESGIPKKSKLLRILANRTLRIATER